MPTQWQLGKDLSAFLRKLMAEAGLEGLGAEYYPSILWSLGGERRKGDQVVEVVPAMYSLGWIKAADIELFFAIPSTDFGFVAFRPCAADENAVERTVDIANNKIFVA